MSQTDVAMVQVCALTQGEGFSYFQPYMYIRQEQVVGFLNQYFADNAHLEVDIEEVERAISADTHTILDVREQDEWDGAHIEQSIHIPLGDLVHRAVELPEDKPIYTICHSGVRSLTAIDILQGAGHEGVKSMAGGVVAWHQAGKPLVN